MEKKLKKIGQKDKRFSPDNKVGGVKMKRVIVLLMLAFFTSSAMVFGGEVKLINKEELKTVLENPGVTVFDVRLGRDWDSSEYKIKNAIHLVGDKLESEMNSGPRNRMLVFYCA